MASRKRKTSTAKSPAKRKKSAPARQRATSAKQRLAAWTISPELSDLKKLLPHDAVRRPPIKGVECLTKSPIFELAEAKFNSLRIEQKEQLLRELLKINDMPQPQRSEAFMQLCERYQLLRGATAQRHVREDWLESYFSSSAVNTIVTAVAVATQRAVDTGLPLDMYWGAGPDDAGMRFAVAESAYQITLLLFTPKLVGPETPIMQLKRPERIWLTSTQEDGTVSVMQQIATAIKRAP